MSKPSQIESFDLLEEFANKAEQTLVVEASLDELLSEELEEVEVMQERRRSPRHPFQTKQMYAEYDGVDLPPTAQFRLAAFQDISSTGISFVLPAPPRRSRFILAIGVVPFHFFEAEQVHIRETSIDGKKHYQIGCRLVRKITTSQPT